jgi:ABC-type cobalamin/Fe3+-siderophores transport system ATPase subunit
VFSVEKLNVCYGNNLVLKDISFNINEGEFVAVIGHNGCGKSTLLKTLIGVKKYSSGKVLF